MYIYIMDSFDDSSAFRTLQSKNLPSFAILKLYTSNPELREVYASAIQKHNKHIITHTYPDSGFDLYVPDFMNISKINSAVYIDFEVKSQMVVYNSYNKSVSNTAFYMYPRSSFSKTPLILGNHVGVIDSGYRGNLIGAFKYIPNMQYKDKYVVEKGQRLLQICHPSLCPIYVTMLEDDNFENTERGSGGFGSTGI